MNLSEALFITELDLDCPKELYKEQYRWLVKTYHPDNKKTGDQKEFVKILQAFDLLRKYYDYR